MRSGARTSRVYPFHCTKIADGTRDIPVGVAVEFTVAPGPLGRWEAVGIRPAPVDWPGALGRRSPRLRQAA